MLNTRSIADTTSASEQSLSGIRSRRPLFRWNETERGWSLCIWVPSLDGWTPQESEHFLGHFVTACAAFLAEEINETSWRDGLRTDSELLITPGLILGRIPLSRRVALVSGDGNQITTAIPRVLARCRVEVPGAVQMNGWLTFETNAAFHPANDFEVNLEYDL